MRKKTIAWLFIPGIILAIIGYALYGVALAGALTAANAGDVPQFGATFYLGLAIAFIGGILAFISWIGALVATAKQGRWGWFVAVLILNGLGELIYLIAGPGL